jgi:hypothetical protein
MEMQQGGWLSAIEHSWLGVLARESVWLYATANVLHILALTVFAASVAMMDARLLGAFREIAPGPFVNRVRVVAIAAFMAMILTGSVLFAAEATHVSVNPVFRIKLLLIAAALTNALVFELAGKARLNGIPAGTSTPALARASAAISLVLWFSVAAAGRLIAYF